jgi:4-hydroxythreonine-4-phosphate dehydrogenase
MLVITLGDPLSVNIPLVLTGLKELTGLAVPVVLVGSYHVWQQQAPTIAVHTVASWGAVKTPGLYFLDVAKSTQNPTAMSLQERGEVAVKSLEALKALSFKAFHGVFTAPIDKKACHEAGFLFPGHTEFFSDWAQQDGLMLLAGDRLRVGLVTQHLALKNVSQNITVSLILQKGRQLAAALQNLFGIVKPRIAVCGLNPHASDQGLFGDEEALIITPAVKQLQDEDEAHWLGPVAADTVFYRAYHKEFDAVLAMYHDQGLGPLKTVHFDDAVNITCGLPFLRVSPDHGPAKDLFATPEKASSASTCAAFRILRRQYENSSRYTR